MPEIIVFEVTNRCNLDCMHCNKVVNQPPLVDIDLELVDSVLTQAKPFNPRVVALSGGEPTIHKDFEGLIRTINKHGIDFTMTTNGQNFSETYKVLVRYATNLKGVSFSIEGATAETNDPIRGHKSFEKVMEACKLAKRHGIPFAMQAVVSTRNVGELEAIAELADALGSDDLNFVLMRPAPRAVEEGLILDMEAAEAVEERVANMRDHYKRLKVGMTTGYHSPWPLYACRPLGMTIIGIDYNGYMRFCPDISNYRGAESDTTDIIADLNMRTLQWSLKALANRIDLYWQNKIDHVAEQDLTAADYYPCYYCLRYFNKSDCLDI